jgi:alpha-L-fucosidase
MEYDVERGKMINTLLLQEDIEQGQRVERFTVDALIDGTWQRLAEGTTIGYKRLLRFSDCRAERIRVTINECRSTANISNVALYYAEPLHDEGHIIRTSDIPTDNWQTVGIDAAEAIDGDIATVWHSEGLTPITIDLGEVIDIAGFCYAPMSDGGKGTIYRYNAYVSEDGETWTECICDGEFSNIENNPIPYFVNLGCRLSTRYLRIEPLSEVNDMNATSVAEIGVLLAR